MRLKKVREGTVVLSPAVGWFFAMRRQLMSFSHLMSKILSSHKFVRLVEDLLTSVVGIFELFVF